MEANGSAFLKSAGKMAVRTHLKAHFKGLLAKLLSGGLWALILTTSETYPGTCKPCFNQLLNQNKNFQRFHICECKSFVTKYQWNSDRGNQDSVVFFVTLRLDSTLPYATLLSSMLCYLLYSTLLYSTLFSCTLLYSTLLHSTLLSSPILYSLWKLILKACWPNCSQDASAKPKQKFSKILHLRMQIFYN